MGWLRIRDMTKVTSEGGRGYVILVWRDSYPRCDPLSLSLSLPLYSRSWIQPHQALPPQA